MAKPAAACGADGLIVELPIDPMPARWDGAQSLHLNEFGRLMTEVGVMLAVVDWSLAWLLPNEDRLRRRPRSRGGSTGPARAPARLQHNDDGVPAITESGTVAT